ncbi:hypothetical protein ACH47Z_39170 [Streptomyces sp. NPDC020192]|uniref:MmyB family transcriptional regulator n=1 Tax=Streptomyces sp. NPDC020192 TaxID=3365066 RepID=UPI0037B95CDD
MINEGRGRWLDALARALRLDEVEYAHLRDLAAPTTRHRAANPRTPQRPDPGLVRLMHTLDHVPVLLLGHRGEVLARNALLAEALGRPLEPGTSLVRFMFQDPVARERIVNWADFASATVAAMRREIARRTDDNRLAVPMDELRTTDCDVARWWDDHAVGDYTPMTKRLQHPTAGPMSFNIEQYRVRLRTPRAGPAAHRLHDRDRLPHRPCPAAPGRLDRSTRRAAGRANDGEGCVCRER